MDGTVTPTPQTHTSARHEFAFASGDDRCAAWLYMPAAAGAGPVPVIVLGHGIAGTREMRLGAFAERFRTAGYACLVFDYRTFGASTGSPRDLIDIGRQLEDWRAAVAAARTLPGIDPDRVIVWGTSFGGGHAIVTAADDPSIAAAIAQCPFTDGMASARVANPRSAAKVTGLALCDVVAAALRRRPVRVPVHGCAGEAALMTAPDVTPGYRRLVDEGEAGARPGPVPARIALALSRHRPGRRAKDVRCPILFVVCDHDSVAPARASRRHARRAPKGEISRFAGGHFDIYVGEAFERVVASQLDFLRRAVPPVPRIDHPSPARPGAAP